MLFTPWPDLPGKPRVRTKQKQGAVALCFCLVACQDISAVNSVFRQASVIDPVVDPLLLQADAFKEVISPVSQSVYDFQGCFRILAAASFSSRNAHRGAAGYGLQVFHVHFCFVQIQFSDRIRIPGWPRSLHPACYTDISPRRLRSIRCMIPSRVRSRLNR